MNVLFLTLLDFESVYERNIYTDLLREFLKHGHHVYTVSPVERRRRRKTHLAIEGNSVILRLRTGNMQKTSIIEKGISTVLIEPLYISSIKRYFENVKFDLVLYSTPPITLCRAVEYVKKRDCARTYLLLKDIFPQNAVDIGLLSKTGLKGLLYRYFRKKEKRLYEITDTIGCKSTANEEYVLRHNPEVRKRNEAAQKQTSHSIVEVCPNSIEPVDLSVTPEERREIRNKYHIPLDRTVFVYGGNLGKPQGIDFMLKCLHSQKSNDKVFFLIVGNGTEYGRIERYIEKYHPENIALRQWIPKEEYDKVIAACDVGMIFLDHRFTIPNFPSRLLGYMSAKLPVLAVTDRVTDIGKVIVDGGFGWWCESDTPYSFDRLVNNITILPGNKNKGLKGYSLLNSEFSVSQIYSEIMKSMIVDKNI